MTTNLLANLVLTVLTNVTNVTVELPIGGPDGATTARYITTNVYERSVITWTFAGRTNSAAVDRLIYTATQVMRLRQTWEPGELSIQQPR